MKTKPPASEEKSTVRTYDLVLEYLKGQILEGKLTLGAKLPSERSLMAELGLSRNSVREALRQLENMGEDADDYASIWNYTHGETEPRFGLYVYPDFGFATTDRVSNLELE